MQYNHDLRHCLHSPRCCQGSNESMDGFCHCCCCCCCWKYLTPLEFCCLNRMQFQECSMDQCTIIIFPPTFVVSFSCFAARDQKENEDHSSRDRWIFGCLEGRRAEVCFTHSPCKNKYDMRPKPEIRIGRYDALTRHAGQKKHVLKRSESSYHSTVFYQTTAIL